MDTDPSENTRAWLATQHRDRFIAGDAPPLQVTVEMHALACEYRRAMGFPVIGVRLTADDYNKALDWHQHRAVSVDDLALLDWPDDMPKEA